MAETRALGLEYIKVGELNNGGMATTLDSLGVTYKDTAELTQGDPEVTEHFSEENDEAEEIVTKKGATEIKWSIMNYDPNTLAKVLGGTVSGTSPNFVWEAPSSAVPIEQSIEIMDKNSNVLQIPRAKITAKMNWKLSSSGVALVEITAKVLTPTDGSKSMKWTPAV